MPMCRRNPDTLKRLNETERKMKEKKLQDYINMDLSNEEREKGNQVRHLGDFPSGSQAAMAASSCAGGQCEARLNVDLSKTMRS